jgi:hypothetical protein
MLFVRHLSYYQVAVGAISPHSPGRCWCQEGTIERSGPQSGRSPRGRLAGGFDGFSNTIKENGLATFTRYVSVGRSLLAAGSWLPQDAAFKASTMLVVERRKLVFCDCRYFPTFFCSGSHTGWPTGCSW